MKINTSVFNLPDIPCISFDVIIDGFVLISSICIGIVGFACSTALNGVYPVDTTGYSGKISKYEIIFFFCNGDRR